MLRVPDSALVVIRRVCAPRPTRTTIDSPNPPAGPHNSRLYTPRRTPPNVRTALFPRLKPKPAGARVTATGMHGRSVSGGEGLNDGGW